MLIQQKLLATIHVSTLVRFISADGSCCSCSGLISLCFVDGANSLYAVSSEGIIVHMNSENGESVRDFKATESPISSAAFSYGK